MAKYRIYCLDGTHKLVSAGWVEGQDDDIAIERVKEKHRGFKCELWDGQRLVARLDLRGEE